MSNRVKEIDGLRAIAMTMVIAQHCKLLPFGWIGVWLFYVISGYVITRSFLSEDGLNLSIKNRYLSFMGRRFFRIVPIYLLYILIIYSLQWSFTRPVNFKDLTFLLTFTFNWQMIYGYEPGSGPNWLFGHLWTLSVEEQFYLFFPLIALISPLRFRLPITVVFVILGPIIRYIYSESIVLDNNNEWSAFSVYASSICHFDAFLCGSLIARLEPYLVGKPNINYYIWTIALLLFFIYITSYILVNYSMGANGISMLKSIVSGVLYGQHREVFIYLVVDLFISALLIQILLKRDSFSFLSSHFLVKVGAVSYSGYLFHLLLLPQASKMIVNISFLEATVPRRLAIFLIVWILTVSLAYISFHWFETPIAKWGRARLSSKILHP